MKQNLLMKPSNLFKIATVVFAAAGLSACDVDKTQDGEMPEVQVEGGQMPEYDVDAADVNVGTVEKEMEVPKVTMEEETVTVPAVGVEMPDEDGPGPAAEPSDRE